MLTGAHYPVEKTEKITGKLPYSLIDGISETISWMQENNLIKN